MWGLYCNFKSYLEFFFNFIHFNPKKIIRSTCFCLGGMKSYQKRGEELNNNISKYGNSSSTYYPIRFLLLIEKLKSLEGILTSEGQKLIKREGDRKATTYYNVVFLVQFQPLFWIMKRFYPHNTTPWATPEGPFYIWTWKKADSSNTQFLPLESAKNGYQITQQTVPLKI